MSWAVSSPSGIPSVLCMRHPGLQHRLLMPATQPLVRVNAVFSPTAVLLATFPQLNLPHGIPEEVGCRHLQKALPSSQVGLHDSLLYNFLCENKTAQPRTMSCPRLFPGPDQGLPIYFGTLAMRQTWVVEAGLHPASFWSLKKSLVSPSGREPHTGCFGPGSGSLAERPVPGVLCWQPGPWRHWLQHPCANR